MTGIRRRLLALVALVGVLGGIVFWGTLRQMRNQPTEDSIVIAHTVIPDVSSTSAKSNAEQQESHSDSETIIAVSSKVIPQLTADETSIPMTPTEGENGMLPLPLKKGVASGEINETALAKIKSAIAKVDFKKQNRSEVQEKIDSALLECLEGEGLSSSRQVELNADNMVKCEVTGVISDSLIELIEKSGGKVTFKSGKYESLSCLLPVSAIETIAADKDVRRIDRALGYVLNKNNTSQGDTAHKAQQARSAFNVSGKGVKVGVISNSARYLSQMQATGDLPSSVTVLPGYEGIAYNKDGIRVDTGEGSGMMEIVYDLAPKAELYFATSGNSEAEFASAIEALSSVGCKIIVDDISFICEPALQDGKSVDAINRFIDEGGIYFSSAGNSGNLSAGTSGTWEGDFSLWRSTDKFHTFMPSSDAWYNKITKVGSFITLEWADQWGASSNDYDLYLFDSDFELLASSTDVQNGRGNPIEAIYTKGLKAPLYIVVEKRSGNDRYLRIDTHRGRLQYATAGSTYGHNAADRVFCVGAAEAPTGRAFGSTDPLEVYSSDGPRKVFFNHNGVKIGASGYLSSGGITLNKPDITAADNTLSRWVELDVKEENSFPGTSAAAPHAAAITALMLEANPELSRDEVFSILTSTTFSKPAWNRNKGYGILDAYAAVETAKKKATPTISLSSISISGSSTVSSGGNTTYTCTAMMSDGTSKPITPDWSIYSGSSYASINASGKLMANMVTSSQSVTVKASYTEGGVMKTATKSVTILASISIGDALDNTTLMFTTGGDSSWFGQTTTTLDGVDSVQSGVLGDNQSNWIQTIVSGPGTISFWWYVSSEANYDCLEFLIDGEVKNSISGKDNLWTQINYSIASGSHKLQWRYRKDASIKVGLDAGFVDQVVWKPTSSLSSISITGPDYVFAGKTGTFGVSATTSDDMPISITPIWSIESGASYASIGADGVLTGNTVISMRSVTIKASYTEGGETISATKTVTIYPTFTLATALDNGTLTFTTGGGADWFGQGKTTYDGANAARSGIITDGQNSWMQTTVTGPGTFSFRWYASSEVGTSGWYDYLTFSIDGVQADKIGGTSCSWTKCSYTLGAGTHVLRWNYLKDISVSRGEDAGFVDEVVWSPTPVLPAAPTGISASDGEYTNGVAIFWTGSSGATSYNLYRSTNLTRPSTPLKTGVTSPCADMTTIPGITYYYWVSAVNSAGSNYSSYDSGYCAVSALLDSTTASFTPAGGTGTTTLTANTSWTALSDVSWITLTASSGSGDGSVAYTVAANTTTEPRTGTITITVGGGTSHPIEKTITISQEAAKLMGKYTIRFNANGGIGTMASQEMTYDVAKNLTANAFTRKGYTFAGWATNVNGAVVYADGASIKNLTATNGGVVDLYAKWTANTYFVMFNANGGTGTMAKESFVYDTAKTLPANAFTRTGYTFAGWAHTADGNVYYADKASVKNLYSEQGVTVILYAKWTVNTYSVKFNANGGVGTMANESFVFDEAKALTANVFTRTGYTFAGWAMSANGEVVYADKASVKYLGLEHGMTVNLFAKWTANTYTIKFDANGGTGMMADLPMTYDRATTPAKCSFERVDYDFLGWATQKGGAVIYREGEAVKNLTATNGGVVTLYAVWRRQIPGAIEVVGPFDSRIANIYDGYLVDQDLSLVGTIQVKTAKQTVKNGVVSVVVTATVTDLEGKKWNYSKGSSTTVGLVSGLVCTAKGCPVPTFAVQLGANGFSGTWGEHEILGARNGMGIKGDAMMTELEKYKGKWSLTVDVEDTVRLLLDVGAKGVVKVSGNWETGTKVSVSAQLVMGEAFACVPVLVTAKNVSPLRLIAQLMPTGEIELISGGDLVAGGRTVDKLGEATFAASEVSAGGKAFRAQVTVDELAYPAKFAAKGLPAGLKIDAATGVISGTPTKPGRYTVVVTVTSGLNSKVKIEKTVEIEVANFTDALIPVQDIYGPYYVGVVAQELVAAAEGCTVSGLPAGLKWTAKDIVDSKTQKVTTPANTIYGVPTKAVTNTVYFKKSVKEIVDGKQKTVAHQASATFVVEGLRPWSAGTFDSIGDLPATVTVAANGKVSGKLVSDGLTWTLSAPSYASFDPAAQIYAAEVSAKSGKELRTFPIEVSPAAGGYGVLTTDLGFMAVQNLWKTEPWKTEGKTWAKRLPAVFTSATAAGLLSGESVTLKFAASGAVSAAGVFANGYKATCSTVLIPYDSSPVAFVYFPPNEKKGFRGYSACLMIGIDGKPIGEVPVPEAGPDVVQLWENGPYWAKTNIGAEKPEDYGYYFWWGDTAGYTRGGGTWSGDYYYNGVTWMSSTGEGMSLSPFLQTAPTYNKTVDQLKSLGYVDASGNLTADHDAATYHLGMGWRMPTDAEFSALLINCDSQWTTQNGVAGLVFKGRGVFAGNSIFLPTAGHGNGSLLYGPGNCGYYWSSSLYTTEATDIAGSITFDSSEVLWEHAARYNGFAVRPVRDLAGSGSQHSVFPTISALTATGRDPIDGKIDVNLTIMGNKWPTSTTTLSFSAVNNTNGANLPMRTLAYANGASSTITSTGNYHIVWDAAADLGRVSLSDVTITATLAENGGSHRTTSRVTSASIDTRIPSPGSSEHAYVQLWANGPYWATTNIGAEKPEDYGYYFWWGDTVGYVLNASKTDIVTSDGSATTHLFISSSSCTPTYNKTVDQLKSMGYVDASGNLAAEHDAATQHWGSGWRMPTDEEFTVLLSYCDTQWTTQNGVAGCIFKGRGTFAGNSIFFPAAGYIYPVNLNRSGVYGYYWSSTPHFNNSLVSWDLIFSSDYHYYAYSERYFGRPVRPVRDSAQ